MSLSSRQPRTLHKVALRASDGEQAFGPTLREFVDHFAANPAGREASLRARSMPLGDLRDACPGATADHPARL
jgi:hypothetical protein